MCLLLPIMWLSSTSPSPSLSVVNQCHGIKNFSSESSLESLLNNKQACIVIHLLHPVALGK